MVGKTLWKPLELSLPRKKVNQKQYASLEGLQGLPSSRTWMHCGDSHHTLSTYLFGLCRKQILENDSRLS